MRIVLVVSSLNAGGSEQVLSALANEWVQKGHNISLVTLAHAGAIPFYHLNDRIQLINLNQSSDKKIPLIMRAKYILRRIFCLRNAVCQLNPDVIVSFVDVMNITTLVATMGCKIPVIVSERTHPACYKLPKIYRMLRSCVYPGASQIVVQTRSVANYFRKLVKVRVIANAITKPKKMKQGFFPVIAHIVSVGRLCPFKGFDTLIKAVGNILKHHAHLSLTIYGEGAERTNLEKLVKSMNLEDKVFLPGVTKNIQEALLDADLFVFPSHYEGFPNALCEAMALGLPVIASNCSGTIDIIRDGVDGRLFPVGDAEALTRIALELISDQQQREHLSKGAQSVIARFNAERIFATWDALLLDAVEGAAALTSLRKVGR